MNLDFEKSFIKDLGHIRDNAVKASVREAIARIEQAHSLRDIANLSKLKGGDDCYRIRVGAYRVGTVLDGNTLIFVRILLRRDIYRFFP